MPCKIVITNNKGGQGKTMFATLIALYLAGNEQNVGNIVCCDLDLTQRDFSDNLKGSGLPIISDLNVIPEEKTFCVIDTPANLATSAPAIQMADILIVPVILGKHSIQGVLRVAEIRGKKDLRIIINEWDGSTVQKEAEAFLQETGINIAGKLPKYKRLAYNMDAGLEWHYGFTKDQAMKIVAIFNRLFFVK